VCGRYVQVSSPRLLAERFDVDEVVTEPHEPDYNVAPRADVYGVLEREPGSRLLESLRWGLVPSWADDLKIGDRLVNARAETLTEKPAYRRAFARRRCILPADGFYEWQRLPKEGTTKARKQPVFIHRRDGEPLAFAGLWEAWRDPGDPDAPWVVSCVIVTTRANELLEPIHDRMPVVLDEGNWSEWLDPRAHDLDRLAAMLVPAPPEWFEVFPVSTLVNKADHNGPELVRPVESATLFP
jgi:putative SOS response-associated peptidase YedK